MSRNISEICLEIGKTVKRSGASAEASIKVDELLVEIVEAKNEVYLQGRTDQKHEDEDAMIVLTKSEIGIIREKAIDDCLDIVKDYFGVNIIADRIRALKGSNILTTPTERIKMIQMIASLCATLSSTSGCECCPYFHKDECPCNNGIDAWLNEDVED